VYYVLSAFYKIASFFYFHNFYISVYCYNPLETFIELPVIFCFSVKLFLCSSVPADAIIESVQRGMLVFFHPLLYIHMYLLVSLICGKIFLTLRKCISFLNVLFGLSFENNVHVLSFLKHFDDYESL